MDIVKNQRQLYKSFIKFQAKIIERKFAMTNSKNNKKGRLNFSLPNLWLILNYYCNNLRAPCGN